MMVWNRTPGPAWLGIGAQRSGTTWFTELLCQHPEVGLGANGKKEQHALNVIADGEVDHVEYCALFGSGLVGEFTPVYLRSVAAAPVAVRLCRPDAPFIVLLRDPLDRFISAIRLRLSRPRSRWSLRTAFMVAQWAGMYADQLDAWAAITGRERLIVFQYEVVKKDPQAAVDVVWRRLGVSPVPLSDIESPSKTTSKAFWEPTPERRDALIALYGPQVERLTDWGINPALWPNFA
jgi:hypothetical protein